MILLDASMLTGAAAPHTLAQHIPPAVTIPLAVLVAGWAGWYWHRLGRSRTPRVRRLMRRASLIVMIVALPVYVAGLSFVDPNDSPGAYVWTWAIAMTMLMFVVILAIADIAVNLRLGHAEQHVQRTQTIVEMARLVQQAREEQQQADEQNGPGPHDDGHDDARGDRP